MKKLLLYILVMCMGTFASAQNKQLAKAYAEKAKKNYRGALKITDKLLEADYKNSPEVLMLKSELLFNLSKDETYVKKEPYAFKEALKFAEKSLSKDPEGKMKQIHKDYLSEIIKINNKEGKEAIDLGKYARAVGIFKRSCDFGSDTFATVMLASCYWNMDDKYHAVDYYKSAAQWINNGFLDSGIKVQGWLREPYRNLGMYYLDKHQFDTAWMYVKMGKAIFPDDPKLKEINYALMRITTHDMPPSLNYLDLVKDGLREYPEDSFFNVKENSLYIFLINNAIKQNEPGYADTLLQEFTASKIAKSKNKQADKIKQYDIFVNTDEKKVLYDFGTYMLSVGAKPFAKFVLSSWADKAKGASFKKPEGYLLAIAESTERKDISLTRNLYEFGLADFPKNKSLTESRRNYTKTKNLSILGYYELEDLLKLNIATAADFPKEAEFKNNTKRLWLKLVDMAADSGNFALGYKYYYEGKSKFPEEKAAFKALQRKLAEKDFAYNYVNSRVNLKGKSQPGVPEYDWNGAVNNCTPGKMDTEIQGRIVSRINYFRRQSGVSEEISLLEQYNKNCEWAAMMCEVNKTMSHEPSDAWQCYVPAGADGLKFSILSKDANPSIAVTAAMGQNHKTMGFRRWLLYPKAKYMGVGAAKTYTAIWALDDAAKIDSSKYKNHFTAWPNAGFVPDMLLFKKWTFSLDQNLKGATVAMAYASGAVIELVQEELADGYGLPTLVWEPKLTLQTEGDTVVNVTVTLKNGKKYQYEVTVFKPKS